MRHYLDGTGVEEPEGFAGLYLEKVRNTRFGGMLRKGIGRVRGVGEVMFTEPTACNILAKAFDKDKTDASVIYKVIDENGVVIVNSEINYSNFRQKRAGWSITLRDEGSVETLELQADQSFLIAPNRTKELKTLSLATSATHEIDPANNIYSWKVPSLAKSLNHALTWKAKVSQSDVTGSPQSVAAFDSDEPVWLNNTTTTRTVQVVGRVTVSHRANTVISGIIRVKVGTQTFDKGINVGTSLETKSYVIDQIVSVPVNGEIFISVEFASTRTDFYFEYLPDSYLSINQDAGLPATQVKCITTGDAMKACIAGIDPNLTLTLTGVGDEIITTGKLLRGVVGDKVSISFGALFDDLNRMKNLIAYSTDSNKLVIKPKASFLQSLGDGLVITDVQDYEFAPSPTLMNRIMVGYSRWQSYTPTGSEEVFGTEEFATGLQKIDSLVNLICPTLCASEKLIEYVRRVQFQAGGTQPSKFADDDGRIFMLEGALTPKQIIQAWQTLWSGSTSTLTKTTGTPNKETYQITADEVFFTGRMCSLQAGIMGQDWGKIDDVVTFYDDNGKKVRLYVLTATYQPGAAGSGLESNLMIEGLEMI